MLFKRKILKIDLSKLTKKESNFLWKFYDLDPSIEEISVILGLFYNRIKDR